MERIRTYNAKDFFRASQTLERAKVAEDRTTFAERVKQKGDLIQNAEAMHRVHKEWVDSKFQPLLPYLQRDTPFDDRHRTEEQVNRRYLRGLSNMAFYLGARGKGADVQDLVVDYTGRFVRMLRTCEALDVKPALGLTLAAGSFAVPRRELSDFFSEDPAIVKLVLERAEEDSDPADMLEIYFATKRHMNSLRDSGHEYEFRAHISSADSKGREEKRGDDLYKIEGVPGLKQRHHNWCGVTSLAMLLQHAGYPDITPEMIFQQTNGLYDPALEMVAAGRGPDIGSLALAATELTPLKARILRRKDYQDLSEKNPQLDSPHAVLRTFLKKDIPCMVRTPGHFVVIKGFARNNESYVIVDPFSGGERIRDIAEFESSWESNEEGYPGGASYLTLALYPVKSNG